METKNLKLGSLEVQNVTQRKVAILGGTGSGKTTTLKMLAYSSPVKVYVFDPLNVIYIEGFTRVLITKKMLESGAAAGKLFNKVKDEHLIFAFDKMLQSEMAKFINDFFSTWTPSHCLICLDEVHEFVPEKGGVYAPEVERGVRHWRNSDCGFVMDSQRPALVKKNVLALTDHLVLYRTTWTHDRDAVKELLQSMLREENVKEIIGKIQTLPFLTGFSIDFRGKGQQ